MKKNILILILIASGILLAQKPSWIVKQNKMPYPVSGGQVVYDPSPQSTKVYIFGGYSDSLQQAVDWIQEYDVEKDQWRIVGHMLQPRQQFVADLWNEKVLFFGGTVDSSKQKTTMESWDFLPFTQTKIVDDNQNFGRAFSTGHIINDNLYIIGGTPSGISSTQLPYITAYNLKTKETTIKYDFTSDDKPRNRSTFIIGDNIYIFGGFTNGVTEKIQKFNITTQKLFDLQERLITPRGDAAGIYNPTYKKGYIIGGRNENSAALSSVEVITLSYDGSLKIQESAKLNYARTNLMVVNYRGAVAVFGGKDIKGKVVPYVEILIGETVDIKNEKLPTSFYLSQNYPNPFNPETVIDYQISNESKVELKVYDILGNEISTLVNEIKQPGIYHSTFNAKELPSGVYFYKISITSKYGNYFETKKMTLIK
ncbi:Kelch repeat-containing protein [Stygiobacter electus]|uniref:T9SS type A sorting domain-containing protein n=1 Tax=Stygiobacter electus TaxID=3032292 RepID=A0AAE3NVL0_9BACT|nr:T9SS type A sorting domain-containing protein [Stygiobacter electus]MDF1611651.1 T9SS type A sorting domain-containing protein [Stygiobacter electus]